MSANLAAIEEVFQRVGVSVKFDTIHTLKIQDHPLVGPIARSPLGSLLNWALVNFYAVNLVLCKARFNRAFASTKTSGITTAMKRLAAIMLS